MEEQKKDFWKKNGLILSFIISFTIHMVCNLFVPMIHFNPDELGAITAAAKLSGYNWDSFWSEIQVYYGVIFGVIFTPLFMVIKNPFILYQCMIAIMAFFHSLIAPLSYKIMTKYYHIKNYILVFVGAIGCSFMVAWRSTNVMNETPLLLCVWLVFYLFTRLQKCTNVISQKRDTVFLVFALCVTYMSHTRGLIVVIAAVMTIIFYSLLTKRNLVDIKILMIAGIIGIIGTLKAIDTMEIAFFARNPDGTLHNSLASMGDVLKVDSGVTRRFSIHGVAGFLDMFTGNLFAIFIITFGTSFMAVGLIIWKFFKLSFDRFIKKQSINISEDIFFSGLFCALGLGGSLVAYSILNMSYAMAAYAAKVTISYYLYPRYFGIYFGPLLLVVFVTLCKEKFPIKYLTIFSMVTFLCTAGYSFVRYIYDCAIKGGDVLDAWRVLLPLTFTTKWNKSITFQDFIQVSIVCILIVILFIVLCKIKRKMLCVLLITVLLIYQYVITSVVYDRGISIYCYNLVDKMYQLMTVESIDNYIDTIHVDRDANGRTPYMLQYLLPDKNVIFGTPKENESIVFTTRHISAIDTSKYEDYKYILLDIGEYNECCLIKGKELEKVLVNAGYTLKNINE